MTAIEQDGGLAGLPEAHDRDALVAPSAARPSNPPAAPLHIQSRLDRGQQFNAYELTSGGWLVGIGPVTDCFGFALADSPADADLVVDALRTVFGQHPSYCRCADRLGPAGGEQDLWVA